MHIICDFLINFLNIRNAEVCLLATFVYLEVDHTDNFDCQFLYAVKFHLFNLLKFNCKDGLNLIPTSEHKAFRTSVRINRLYIILCMCSLSHYTSGVPVILILC